MSEPGVLYRIGRSIRHLSPPLRPAVSPPRTLQEAAGELEELLMGAVASRLNPNGTTITFVSGGVDSSLLCVLAASQRKDGIEAVTVGFDQNGFDESEIARQVAGYAQVPHRVLVFPMSLYRNAFERLTAGIQYPSADPAAIPTLLAFEAAREVSVHAIDGTGADTLFGVMPARHQRVAVQYGARLPPPLRRVTSTVFGAIPGLRQYVPLVDFDDPEEVLIRWRGWRRKEIASLCCEPVSLEHTRFYQLFRQFTRSAHLERYSTLLGNLPDDRIHLAASLTGLDVRFPYFDPRVVDWVRGLEYGLRYNPRDSKPLLKAVLARLIPRQLWEQPKHGFDFPFVHLMRLDNHALVHRYLDPDVTNRWSLFDSKQIRDIKHSFLQQDSFSAFDRQSPAFRTWTLIVLFAWLENHYRHL